jgi:hypothetical protein
VRRRAEAGARRDGAAAGWRVQCPIMELIEYADYL